MLQVSNLSKSFGDRLVFERVSFVVNRGERVGLIGPNGCGKTTLLKIVAGQIQPDTGSAKLSPSGARAGYLAQALEFEAGQTVGQMMKTAVAGLAEAERRLEILAADIAAARGIELQRTLGAYDRAIEAFERLGGYGFRARVEAVLDGLGLRDLNQEEPVAILSGGQKTRLGLARLLLSRPDLLLLDEPTNHLDFDALEWLEEFLRGFDGAALIVSHDRTFLDRTIGSIIELDVLTYTAAQYEGSYTAYQEAKEREQEKHWTAYKEQQERIARLQSTISAKKGYARSIEQGTIDFAPRKIAKGIARKAVVQQRRLQRMIDSEEHIDRPERSWQLKLEFSSGAGGGRDVLQIEGVEMGFGDRRLFHDVTLTLRAGERIALVGPNGSGKTTLARLILSEMQPHAGRIRLGAGVKVGYFAQEQEELEPRCTPYESLSAVARLNQTEIRSFLHRFLFAGEQVFTPVGSLSFGERARLALARLVVQGCNFLLLDEPINHLDIPSRSRFEQAMAAYEGTVLVIVHDRYFIERFASGIWAIEQETIHRYDGLEEMRRTRRAHSMETGTG